jgi:hypothetical protein
MICMTPHDSFLCSVEENSNRHRMKGLSTMVVGYGHDKEQLEQLRRPLGLFKLDAARDADKTEHAATLTFGNDRLNRWSALPVGMNDDQLQSAMCRMMGNSARQRYSAVSQFRSLPGTLPGSLEMD